MNTGGRDRPRRRLLMVTPFTPRLDGMHGGTRSMAQFIQHSASRHEVALVHLRAPGEPELDPQLRERCDITVEVARPWPEVVGVARWTRRLQLLAGLLMGTPTWVTRWPAPGLREELAALARTWRPDAAIIHYVVIARHAQALPRSVPRLLVIGEAAAAAARSARGQSQSPVQRLEERAWGRHERAALASADAVVTFTARDTREMATYGVSTPLWTIPLGTELPAEPLDPVGVHPRRVVFVGNYMHAPNVDAAVHLVNDVMPLVWLRAPGVEVDLVGDGAPASVLRLGGEHVRVTGRVPDVRPWLDAAAVVALPVRTGGGMRVKLLEALALGKAVVSSSLAAEGLDVRHGEQLLIADGPQEFAAAVSELLVNEQKRGALAREARRWACAHLGWDGVMTSYDELYDSLMRRDSSPATTRAAGGE